MTDKEMEQLYRGIRKKNGENKQIIKAIEELNELSVELAKFINGEENLEEIFGELADAKIMIHQISLIFGPKKVRKMQEIKLERLEHLLGVENNENSSEI